MSLNDYKHRDTDKFGLGYIDAFYNDLFIPRKDSLTRLLEIGVFGGESIRLWRDYFENATIYGLDINDVSHIVNEPRVVAMSTNAYSQSTINLLKKMEPEGFDVIIDDGPHTLESMQYFLLNYMDLVKKGGVMVLEDIVNVNWTPDLVKLVNLNVANVKVVSLMGKFVNEEWKKEWTERGGLDVIIVEKL